MRKAALFSALLFLAPACGHSMPPGEAIANLHSPDPNQRRNAADALRTPEGVIPQAIPDLLAQVQVEQDPPARGAMLITLGKSGVPQAKPIIDQAVMTAADPNMQRWAGRALKYWMIQTGQIPAEFAFPPGWPYGQPGYPPIIVK